MFTDVDRAGTEIFGVFLVQKRKSGCGNYKIFEFYNAVFYDSVCDYCLG
jgi:hypothetical protein